MRVFSIFIALCFSLGLSAQSRPVALDDLEIKKDPNGVTVYYLDGQAFSGKTYDFYEQENIALEHHLEQGLLTLKEGFRDGQKIEHVEFKDGILDGVYLKYFGNGQKYVEHRYQSGRMHGLQYGWEKDGTVRFVAEYKNGLEMMRMDYPPPGGFKPMIKN
ncbi:toxin-antitoxin system YwqK family antitoxin [Flavilitoribacter nigricans]|uniref:Toxin-antitoxin system YwqK family antitoxin n=1 Tax=Flavilitoribacter nigricans (strain ATCC 23147 / DSM 23189 / NBRC 102662 / NCIMB 1420 / SS-2) TaxID=1122177 RepID=A0A2D0N9D7_FLAN2|nr:hypothetical protein [Flavilitoribacter nigricans]PHN04759.1 hypothetical protein CRP01_19795 [Flavilitoribacter nigricans DSM 23189 = NBRC 102662]